ncbi:unnamed protein product [Arabidopsis thaliana]|uniref:(thale cress) hypothetical protein n=1 Tax=Arabidopsis thaliana TaxID=3702 RepID=A0A7G2FGZ9_ARATH|nr:unnamed protein product [Arabidopsis thaliana]
MLSRYSSISSAVPKKFTVIPSPLFHRLRDLSPHTGSLFRYPLPRLLPVVQAAVVTCFPSHAPQPKASSPRQATLPVRPLCQQTWLLVVLHTNQPSSYRVPPVHTPSMFLDSLGSKFMLFRGTLIALVRTFTAVCRFYFNLAFLEVALWQIGKRYMLSFTVPGALASGLFCFVQKRRLLFMTVPVQQLLTVWLWRRCFLFLVVSAKTTDLKMPT